MLVMKREKMTNPKTLKSELPSDNPLREFPYWDHPDGKNLNSISCIEWTIAFIETMEKELPCPENKESLWHLSRALKMQRERLQRRTEQGVIGTNRPHELTPFNLPTDAA